MSRLPPIPLAAWRFAFPNADVHYLQREAKMYAKAGLGLAKAWRLAAKIDPREIVGYEKTWKNNRRQAEEKAALQSAKKAAQRFIVPAVKPCRECGLLFSNHAELRLHRKVRHHEYNAPPYHGRLLNPVNWDVQELSPSGENETGTTIKGRGVSDGRS